ncbi:hypothetical protein [Streptomyces broussonetiae]|uniref:hypothetical protein n=1 Tax=Streptomyces broussonetiae TaxID=2686304 RepID=UPI0035DAEE6A
MWGTNRDNMRTMLPRPARSVATMTRRDPLPDRARLDVPERGGRPSRHALPGRLGLRGAMTDLDASTYRDAVGDSDA